MSKQEEAKKKQGFITKSPMCSNCINFKSKKEQVKRPWSSQLFTVESELRCGIGMFKVGKSNWCNEYKAQHL